MLHDPVTEAAVADIVVIGCGNTNRQDDAVGVMVIAALRDMPALAQSGVRLIDAGTDGMAAMYAARGARSILIVDACLSGSDAGAVFEVPGHEVERPSPPDINLHSFRWNHALYAGRKIYGADFPDDVMVYLIEAAETGYGWDLSPQVARARDFVVGRIAEAVTVRLAG